MMQNIFLSIPFPRLIVYLSLFMLLPFVFLFFHFSSQIKKIELAETHLEKTIFLFIEKEQKQAINKACRKHYEKQERYALEHALEALSLLSKERVEMEKLTNHNFFGSPVIEERLSFLNDGSNKLKFIETSQKAKWGVQEACEALIHPVEVDVTDLKAILEIIEKNPPRAPQCLISDFQLSRKENESGNENFSLNMKLLKREFL